MQVHFKLRHENNKTIVPLWVIGGLKNGVYDRFGNVSSWKHCVTTTNNSLHESLTISQAK